MGSSRSSAGKVDFPHREGFALGVWEAEAASRSGESGGEQTSGEGHGRGAAPRTLCTANVCGADRPAASRLLMDRAACVRTIALAPITASPRHVSGLWPNQAGPKNWPASNAGDGPGGDHAAERLAQGSVRVSENRVTNLNRTTGRRNPFADENVFRQKSLALVPRLSARRKSQAGQRLRPGSPSNRGILALSSATPLFQKRSNQLLNRSRRRSSSLPCST